MTKQPASEKEVGELHSITNDLYLLLSKQLLAGLESDDEDERLMAQELTTPALLTSLSRWIAQNKVSCVPEELEELSDLESALAKRRQRRRKHIGEVDHESGLQ